MLGLELGLRQLTNPNPSPSPSPNPNPNQVAVLRAHLDEPVVACVALYWVEKNLTLPQLYSARLTTHSLPIYLGLVGTLADRHPALRRKALRLLARTLALTLALTLTQPQP